MFYLKKNAATAHQMLVDAYGNHALSEKNCREWFQRFKTGDFDVEDKAHRIPSKKFEDEELQVLLDENYAQTQEQLADKLNVTQQTILLLLHQIGKIQKEGIWVSYELSEQNMEQRKTICEVLIERQRRVFFASNSDW